MKFFVLSNNNSDCVARADMFVFALLSVGKSMGATKPLGASVKARGLLIEKINSFEELRNPQNDQH